MSDQLTPEAIANYRNWIEASREESDAGEFWPGAYRQDMAHVLNVVQAQAAELERQDRVIAELLAFEEGLAKKVEQAEAELERLRSDLAAEEKEKLSWRHTVNAIAADCDKWQGQWETVKGVCEQRDAALRQLQDQAAELERLRSPGRQMADAIVSAHATELRAAISRAEQAEALATRLAVAGKEMLARVHDYEDRGGKLTDKELATVGMLCAALAEAREKGLVP